LADRPPALSTFRKMKTGIGSHQSTGATNDEWLTPPHIIQALGPFDLDPCTPDLMPWVTARDRYTQSQNGLSLPWRGRVWLNPPYSNWWDWMDKLASHGNGIALIFARTETEAFHEKVWKRAGGVLFMRGRIHFHYPSGERAKANAGGPSCLIAFGWKNVCILETLPIPGHFVPLNTAT
jgi:hypothetical protein